MMLIKLMNWRINIEILKPTFMRITNLYQASLTSEYSDCTTDCTTVLLAVYAARSVFLVWSDSSASILLLEGSFVSKKKNSLF